MTHPNSKISDQRANSAIDKKNIQNNPQNYKIQNWIKSLLKRKANK